MKKKVLSVFLVLSFVFSTSVVGFCSESSEAYEAYSLKDFSNGEVFVEYVNGSSEVLCFSDESELAEALDNLSDDKNVQYYQPNYSYEATALSVNDSLSLQQWALNNDGSFEMEEEENEYPVYDQPFTIPSAPWQWSMPIDFGDQGGRNGMRHFASSSANSSEQISAVSGIDIGVESAWSAYTGSGSDVTVALIDTGVDRSHEDLQGVLWTNEDEIANNGIDDDGNGYIDDVNGWNFYNNNNKTYVSSSDDSHGTHCAGTIIANTNNGTGIAGIVRSDKVKIMSIKALGGRSGSGSTDSVIKAIKYAEANGASICNLSFGSSMNDQALYRAIANSNMLFVVAAGNDGVNADTSPSYPASYDLDNIISVANLNYNGTLHSSSNYSATSVDLAAPGSYILSTTPNNGYSYMTGTSMAAPMVTAAASMIYSNYTDITLADVKEILLTSVKKLDSLSNNVSSGGMLNLAAAMQFDVTTLSHDTWEVVSTETEETPQVDIPQPQYFPIREIQIIMPDYFFFQPNMRIGFGFGMGGFF